MPLRLTMKPGERVVINGCVVRNDGHRTTLSIENHARILRGKEIMTEDEANTPAKRAYFAVQNLLIQNPSDDRLGKRAMGMLASLCAALADGPMRDAVLQAAAEAINGDYYKSLTLLRSVIAYEADLLTSFNDSLETDMPLEKAPAGI